MASAVLGLLQHELKTAPVGQRLFHPLGLMADNQQLPFGVEAAAAGQHPLHQGGASQRLQHLRQITLHAGALPGGQNGNGEH